jgi:hypothetical protein
MKPEEFSDRLWEFAARVGKVVEALPETFVTDNDRPIDGLNLGLHPGSVAVLCYQVYFSQPGRYYAWTRMRSDDGEDNMLNAGLNDEWPASAKCLQFQKHTQAWQWGNVIRDPKGPQFPRLPAWLDVPTGGIHTVMYSMREDGCEVDRFILTTDENFVAPTARGPAVKVKSDTLPVFSAAKSSANSGDAMVIEAESVSAEGWELATSLPGFSGRSAGHMIDRLALRRYEGEPVKESGNLEN